MERGKGMRSLLRGSAVVLLCAMLLGCAALQPVAAPTAARSVTATPSPAPIPVATDTLTLAFEEAPALSLDPAKAGSKGALSAVALAYTPLMRYGESMSACQSGMAESYIIADDGVTVTVRLREDALWSDGLPVTAADFVFAWKRLLDPATQAHFGYDIARYFYNGEKVASGELPASRLSIRATDAHTLEFRLSQPTGALEQLLAHPALSPLREDIVLAHGDAAFTDPALCVTNSSHRLYKVEEDALTLADSVMLAASAYDEPHTVTFLYNDNTAQVGIRSGAVQVYVAGSDTLAMTDAGECVPYNAPSLQSRYVVFNRREGSPFVSDSLRRAFFHATDGTYVCGMLGDGSAKASTLVSEAYTFLDGSTFCTGDPERQPDTALAKDAFAAYTADGYDEEAWRLQPPRLLVPEDDGLLRMANALNKGWKDTLGVTAQVVALPYAQYAQAYFSGDFELALVTVDPMLADPAIPLQAFAGEDVFNACGFADARFDELYQKGVSKGYESAVGRVALRDAETLLIKDAAVIPLTNTHVHALIRSGYEGCFTFLPNGMVLLKRPE